MGKRGPKPVPTALKIFNGTRIRASRVGEPAPKSAGVCPKPPRWLGEHGKREWTLVAPNLHAVGCLTESDTSMLGQYCSAWDDFFAAHSDVKENGLKSISSKGTPTSNPSLRAKYIAAQMIVKIGGMFGLSPASRVGLKAAPQDPGHDDLENFKSGN